MSSRLIFSSAEVVLRPVFTCNACGVEAAGDRTVRTTVQFEEDLLTLTASRKASAHAMPIGWASYGGDTFKCGRCTNGDSHE